MVWVETPTNPLLGIADIAAIAEVAHEAGALLVVDNTFASPYLQQPLALGADVVVHSTTKYAGGHSDVVGGAVVRRRRRHDPRRRVGRERIAFHQNAMGAVAGPFDAWLVLRGLKTLGVRMERHCDNAERGRRASCSGTTAVTAGALPGPARPPRPRRRRQADEAVRRHGLLPGQGRRGRRARRSAPRPQLLTLGESLGGVESLIEHPGRMTHASVAGTALEVPADLIRLSVGIEDADDLVADLGQALDRLT